MDGTVHRVAPVAIDVRLPSKTNSPSKTIWYIVGGFVLIVGGILGYRQYDFSHNLSVGKSMLEQGYYEDAIVAFDKAESYKPEYPGLYELQQQANFGARTRGYDQVYPIIEGHAIVKKDGKFCFVDDWGNEKTALEYDTLLPFSEGLAAANFEGKYGFINTAGETKLDFIYLETDGFQEGKAWVHRANNKAEFYGFVDAEGVETKLETGFPREGDKFVEGMLWVANDNDKYGYVNTRGKLVVPTEYDVAYNYTGGEAIVKKDGYYSLIDKEGTAKLEFEYDFIQYLNEDGFKLKKGYKYGLANTEGAVMVSCKYDVFKGFGNGVALVQETEDKTQIEFIDRQGNLKFKLSLDFRRCNNAFSLGRLAVQDRDDKWGFLDLSGNLVIPCRFDDIYDFDNGEARVRMGYNWYSIDLDGYWKLD